MTNAMKQKVTNEQNHVVSSVELIDIFGVFWCIIVSRWMKMGVDEAEIVYRGRGWDGALIESSGLLCICVQPMSNGVVLS